MPAPPPPATWEAYARALGVELQRRRIARGLSQEDVALTAGMTRTHYQQIERGWWQPGKPANPSLRALVSVALVLELLPGDLLPPVDELSLPLE